MNHRSAAALSLGILVALAAGALLPLDFVTPPVVAACVGVATLLTVGGLDANWHRERASYQVAGRLFAINLVAGSLPMALVGFMLGAHTPAGAGFLALAVVPVAAGIPAYAGALGVPAARLALFALLSYVVALVVTPILLGLVLGSASNWRQLAFTVVFGLILPSIAGVLGRSVITRAPARPRRAVVITALLVAMSGLGGTLSPSSITSVELGAPLVLVVAIALLRAPVGGLLGALANGRSSMATGVEAAMAGGYKNGALAGAAALSAGVPGAALPGALGLVSEAVLLAGVSLVWRHGDSWRGCHAA